MGMRTIFQYFPSMGFPEVIYMKMLIAQDDTELNKIIVKNLTARIRTIIRNPANLYILAEVSLNTKTYEVSLRKEEGELNKGSIFIVRFPGGELFP